MLSAMRVQALDYLFQEIEKDNPPDDIEKWYQEKRISSPKEIFPFLVESAGQIERVYIIEKDTVNGIVQIRISDLKPEIESALPFVKPIGSRSAQIGPVIKRSYDNKKGAGPSGKILNTTMNYFRTVAKSDKDWAAYFTEIVSVLSEESICLPDGSLCKWKSEGFDSMLECVVSKIGQVKGTVFVTVRTASGKLPGEVPAYVMYLMNEIQAGERYFTGKTEAVSDTQCPLCGNPETLIFPNALKGSGINLSNVDRSGRFPGMDIANAWKSFSLCADCADLLYVYKNHVLKKGGPKKDIRPFTSSIAGETALIIPSCSTDTMARFKIWETVKAYVSKAKTDVSYEEDELLDILKDQKALLNLTFLWCSIGQSLEDVTGVLTDVPPSRLYFLSEFNDTAKKWKHPVFPDRLLVNSKANLEVSLSLSAFYSLFHRPGGKKAPNATRRVSELRKLLADAVYHDRKIPEKHLTRLWDEILITAQWWWLDAINRGDAYGLINEGKGKKGKEDYITAAAWIRHWAWWLYYFKKLGVMEMEKDFYEPEWDELRPYMGRESGISGKDCKEKAFAFLLGVVYGRLIFIQEMAGFRVSVLNWVKRFNTDGSELPVIYKKVQAKLTEYRYNVNDEDVKKLFTKKFHRAVEELSLLGNRLGDRIRLSSNLTGYYLLLGLSLSNKIIKKEE